MENSLTSISTTPAASSQGLSDRQNLQELEIELWGIRRVMEREGYSLWDDYLKGVDFYPLGDTRKRDLNEYHRLYNRRRYHTDPDYRGMMDEASLAYYKRRYWSDPAFRERELARHRKIDHGKRAKVIH